MTSRPIRLIDESQVDVARLDVSCVGDRFEGSIDLAATSPVFRRLFEEYEEVVEGQMFSLLDAIEEKIGTISFQVRFEDGTQSEIEDLQVFPSTQAVSFALRLPTQA